VHAKPTDPTSSPKDLKHPAHQHTLGHRWAKKSPDRSDSIGSASPDGHCYTVSTTMADTRQTGVSGRVLLVLHGRLRTSAEVELRNPPRKERRKNGRHTFVHAHTLFQKGSTNTFRLQLDDVGFIQAVSIRIVPRIGTHLTRHHREWHVENITITAPGGTKFVFQCETVVGHFSDRPYSTPTFPMGFLDGTAAP
jgi:hypothetical protein